MTDSFAYRAGAIAYILWGALHAFVGVAALWSIALGDAGAGLLTLADRAPKLEGAGLGAATIGLLSHHAFNLLWGGIFAVVVGALFNWRNSRGGYWANLAVVSGLDVGFLLFVVMPGHIALMNSLPGPALWVIAIVLTTIGRVSARSGAQHSEVGSAA